MTEGSIFGAQSWIDMDNNYLVLSRKWRPQNFNNVIGQFHVTKTLQNALLEAVGEKAPGFKPRLEKGTELTALAGIRSQLEYLIIPTLALLSSIILLGV